MDSFASLGFEPGVVRAADQGFVSVAYNSGVVTLSSSNPAVTPGNLNINGALNFVGNAPQKITGDMTTTVPANQRFTLQSSIPNGLTAPALMPNGTATLSGWAMYNNSDPLNAAAASLVIDTTSARTAITAAGTAPLVPWEVRMAAQIAFTVKTDQSVVAGLAANGQLGVDASGRVYGTALHNNAAGVAGSTQFIASGTYTPTITPGANVAASLAYVHSWIRIGSVVHVAGKVDITPTAANADTQLGVSLPIASNFGSSELLAGCGAAPLANPMQSAAIIGDVANHRALVEWRTTESVNRGYWYQFSYLVV
jgi:hypothetical protein